MPYEDDVFIYLLYFPDEVGQGSGIPGLDLELVQASPVCIRYADGFKDDDRTTVPEVLFITGQGERGGITVFICITALHRVNYKAVEGCSFTDFNRLK